MLDSISKIGEARAKLDTFSVRVSVPVTVRVSMPREGPGGSPPTERDVRVRMRAEGLTERLWRALAAVGEPGWPDGWTVEGWEADGG